MKVTVIHESGARRHFLGLEAAVGVGNVNYVNLSPLKRTAQRIVRRDFRQMPVIFRDLLNLTKVSFSGRQVIVLALAPYNGWIWLMPLLRARNSVIYYSSWHDWRRGRVPNNSSNRLLESLWRRALQGATAIGVSAAATESLIRQGANARQIPHSVDTAEFTPDAVASGSRINVLFVGRLIEPKGIRLLTDIIRRRAIPDVNWQFAGNGPLLDELRAMEKAGFPVSTLGHLSGERLVAAYQGADILVLPSLSVPGWEELFGIAIIEAFACGVPVIASNCVGPAEVIEHDRTGLLVPVGDVMRLETAISELARDPARRLRLGRSARNASVERYGLEVIGKAWDDLLNAL